jgi:GNAT superfamily N-acetyltransferase
MSSMNDSDRKQAIAHLEENLWGMWSQFGLGSGCCLHKDGSCLWYETPIPTPPYNAVLRFQEEDEADERIDSIFAQFKGRGVPFVWVVHPSSRPANLIEKLQAKGFEEAEVCAGMVMSLDKLPSAEPAPEGVEIREVKDATDVSQALEMIAWRWDVPAGAREHLRDIACPFAVGQPGANNRVWLAWKNGIPISKVVLHLSQNAAGIYGVVTKPEARGLGLARILTIRAFAAAREAGYRMGVLHSSAMAQSLYAKIGFEEVAPFRVFGPPSSFHI